jgi:hypothetical protein
MTLRERFKPSENALGAADAIDDRERIGGRRVAAPGDMPVRPHQH